MAGALTTPTRTTQDIGQIMKAEIKISLACVSDSATGLVPDQALTGLDGYVLTQVQPVPDAVAPFTSAFEIKIIDANTARLYLSGSVAVDSYEILGGQTGSNDGNYPRMDEASTFKIVDPADSVSTLSVGNSKEITIILRFERQV